MDAYQLLEEKIEYNQWANEAIVSWLKGQPGHLLHLPIQSSFQSMNKVLHHIMESETYYLSILTGREAEYPKELPNHEIFTRFLEVDRHLLNWFKVQAPSFLDNEIKIKRSPYEECYTVATIISHVLNHSTFHRGQVVAARQELTLPPPPKTDFYWMYAQRLAPADHPFNG